MNKIILFIATQKGFTVLKHLIDNNFINNMACVVTFQETNVVKQWQGEIINICTENSITHYKWNDVKDTLENLVIKHNATSAIAVSWKYMIPLSINKLLETNLIVLHDSLLPKYRGFAPTPTAIICGEKTIGVTALFATNTVDSGDIILQKEMKITDQMYIQEIIARQSEIYALMVAEIICKMNLSNLSSVKQDETMATYSIWRDIQDCHIDWNQSAHDVYNFIRALGNPYPGAYSYIDEQKIIIETSEVLDCDLDFKIRQPGKIWAIKDNKPTIICGNGLLQITYATDCDKNMYKFSSVRKRLK